MMKLLAVCDGKYFIDYGVSFVKSAAIHKNQVIVVVINPDVKCMGLLVNLKNMFGDLFEYSTQDMIVPMQEDKKRTVYACQRFVILADIMKQNNDVGFLVLDVDSIIRGRILPPTQDLGIFFRDPFPNSAGWEHKGSKVAAGILYVSHKAINFSHSLRIKIESYEKIWFVDQVCISEIYDNYKDVYSVYDYGKDVRFLDWEFKDDSLIWTGKGDRKHSNEKYILEMNKYR